MITLNRISEMLAAGRFAFSRHAFKRAVERNISESEIRQAGKRVIIIEDYPDDKYAPSCLLLGYTENNRPLHIQVTRIEIENIRIITLYEPDASEWQNDFTVRRK